MCSDFEAVDHRKEALALAANAWAVWNASYHAPAAELYQAVSFQLYRQSVHEKIAALYEALDRQNSLLDQVTHDCAA